MIRIVVVAIALMASLAYAKTGDGTWDTGGGWRETNSGSITFKFLEQPSQEALARLAAMPAPHRSRNNLADTRSMRCSAARSCPTLSGSWNAAQ